MFTGPGDADPVTTSLLSPPGASNCVYIASSTNIKTAAELVAEDANAMMAKYPGALVFIVGDFNTCRLDNVLPSFQQYVDIPTRKANILDMCYGNITDEVRARSYPPLGLADHNNTLQRPTVVGGRHCPSPRLPGMH